MTVAAAGLRLASACCVAYVIKTYGVPIVKDGASTLLKAFLLKPGDANGKCADYEQLLDVYLVSEQWRSLVFTSLFAMNLCATHTHTHLMALCPGLPG